MLRSFSCVTFAVLAAVPVAGQNTVALPGVAGPTAGVSSPWGNGLLRYQVWMSAAEWATAVGRPVAVNQLEFMTHLGGQAGRQMQIEVRMANSLEFQPTGLFRSNLRSGETLVFPATPGVGQQFSLPASVAGGYAISIPFSNEFVWDGQSGVVVDLQIYDNGNQGQPFPYDVRTETFATGRIAMLWTLGSPSSNSAAVVLLGRGPRLRFTFRDGVSVPFGAGCPGQGFNVPVYTMSGGDPVPNNLTWTHSLSNASSQRSAIWMFGDSRTTWLSLSLPHELLEVGANGCDLLVKPDLTFAVITVGGGAGSGLASLTTPTPPTTGLVGMSFYSQWLVIDPLAVNGVLAASNGISHLFGP